MIRWLHRWRAPLSSWPVSAIFLWRQTASDMGSGDKKDKPDPAWRRRALAMSLLIIALAGPYRSTETQALSIWIDDSLSAYAIEDGKTRLARMLDSLSAELNSERSQWTEITLRSLTSPGKVRRFAGSGALNPDNWPLGSNSALDGASMPLLAADSEHWLLTDGASSEIRAWVARVSLNRIIQAGDATENSAVTRLAARRSLEDNEIFDVLVSVSNAGLAANERQVSLYTGGEVVQTTRLSLSPNQTSYWQVPVRAADQSLTATLTSADSLPADDSLNLSLRPLELLTTRVDPDCGAAMRRALATHPSLILVDAAADSTLVVSCSQARFAESNFSGAHIRSLLGDSKAIVSPPVWLEATGDIVDLSFSTDWIHSAQWPSQGTTDGQRVLLTSAEQPLVIVHAADGNSSATVDTVVDLLQPRFVEQAEYPAFIATLVDFATGRKLLQEIATDSRDAESSVIIPQSLDVVGPGIASPANQATTKSSGGPLLIAAVLLLLLDAALLLRTRRQARHA